MIQKIIFNYLCALISKWWSGSQIALIEQSYVFLMSLMLSPFFCFQFSGHSGDRCTLIIKRRKPPPLSRSPTPPFRSPDHHTPLKPSINIIRPQRGRQRASKKKTDPSGWTCVLYKCTAGGINSTGWQSLYHNRISYIYVCLKYVTHITAEIFDWNTIDPVTLKCSVCSSLWFKMKIEDNSALYL
jgi:hypothetical protein